jgi:PAS domain-containing protein
MQRKDLEVFNEMPFFFWVKDEEGRYLWVNRAWLKWPNKPLSAKPTAEWVGLLTPMV